MNMLVFRGVFVFDTVDFTEILTNNSPVEGTVVCGLPFFGFKNFPRW